MHAPGWLTATSTNPETNPFRCSRPKNAQDFLSWPYISSQVATWLPWVFGCCSSRVRKNIFFRNPPRAQCFLQNPQTGNSACDLFGVPSDPFNERTIQRTALADWIGVSCEFYLVVVSGCVRTSWWIWFKADGNFHPKTSHSKFCWLSQWLSRWWFQIFLIFNHTWGNDLIWLIFSDGLVQPPTSYSPGTDHISPPSRYFWVDDEIRHFEPRERWDICFLVSIPVTCSFSQRWHAEPMNLWLSRDKTTQFK